MGTREVFEQKLRSGNLYHDPTINPGLGSARCPRCLSLINPNSESAEWTITTVLHEATGVAVPNDASKFVEFLKVIKQTFDFEAKLKKNGFISAAESQDEKLSTFAQNVEVHFASRKRNDILAKETAMKSGHTLEGQGVVEKISKHVDLLFQQGSCVVFAAGLGLMELVHLALKLEKLFDSIDQGAVLVHNDCYYLSQEILGLAFEVVTCRSIPLESSFQKVPRCAYVSTELQEYRGWSGKSANPRHRRLTWGLRHTERHVADFYISDFQSGLRALIEAGYGAKATAFVKPATLVDITKENRELSTNFFRWLADRNLSSDDRVMRLKVGYIKEGNMVSVMGIVQRHDNVLMIVPSQEPVSTGCQWAHFLLPSYIEGLILMCDESQNADVIPV